MLLLILCAALFGYLRFVDGQGTVGGWLTTRAGGKTAAALLLTDSDLAAPAGSGRNLQTVTIEATGTWVLALERRTEATPPGFFFAATPRRADDEAAETLVSTLLSAVADRVVKGGGSSPERYGVHDAGCRVRVRLLRGLVLCFGAQAPDGGVYVRRGHEPDLLVVAAEVFEVIARPPERYRATRLFLANLATVKRIQLGELTMVRERGLWESEVPGNQPSDERGLLQTEQVEALLQRLQAMTARGWVSRLSAPPRTPPSTPPPLTVVLDGIEALRGGWPCPEEVVPLSGPSPRDGKVGLGQLLWLQRSDGEALCVEASEALLLRTRAAELWAKKALPLQLADVQRLQLRRAGAPVPVLDLSRAENGTYTLGNLPAETKAVRDYLEQLLTQELSREHGAVTTVLKDGLATLPPADVEAQVTTVAGRTLTLRGWRTPEPVSLMASGGVVMRDGETPRMAPIALMKLLQLVPTRPQAGGEGALMLRSLRMLQLEPTTVSRLVREWPKTTTSKGVSAAQPQEVLERSSSFWLKQPTLAPADDVLLPRLLDTLAELRALRWVTAEARPEQGLTPPRLRLQVESDGQRQVLELGAEVSGPAAETAPAGCYARSDGPVAVLPLTLCQELQRSWVSPKLLPVDEARLLTVEVTATAPPTGPLRFVLTKQAGRWLVGGQPLAPPTREALQQALHALQQAEVLRYDLGKPQPPSLTLHITQSAPTERSTTVEVGSLTDQTLLLYGDLRRDIGATTAGLVQLTARRADRAVLYQLSPEATRALQQLLTTVTAQTGRP